MDIEPDETDMPLDLTVDLINATVQIEQPIVAPLTPGSPEGAVPAAPPTDQRVVGTGFLIDDPTPDGRPRTILVTAAHVFEQMQGDQTRLGWRFVVDGVWRYGAAPATIRNHGAPLWTRHPVQDIAVIEIKAPEEFARAAVPKSWLADDRTFDDYGVGPGDEMMTLGFPRGWTPCRAGFPILRSGRVASYPLSPVGDFPTFLIDLRVLPGNSGGPVFMAEYGKRRPDSEQASPPVISGVLTKQIELEIGVVVHAQFVRETLELLDQPTPAVRPKGKK
jgi:S1-C subfamily serine protease